MSKRFRRKHSDEFKREAVKLITEQGYSVAAAARNLDVNENLLRTWKKKFETDSLASVNEDEQEELARLRQEVSRLRMERDILKKATAFFANEKN